jgi:2-oxoisovalerate dehydrogenase E1 component
LSIAAKIQKNCFRQLDAPIEIIGSVDTPAIPLNSTLEAALLTNADKVKTGIQNVFDF